MTSILAFLTPKCVNYIIIVMIKRLLLSLYHLFHQKTNILILVNGYLIWCHFWIPEIWTLNFRSAGGCPGSPGTYYIPTGADEQILFFLLWLFAHRFVKMNLNNYCKVSVVSLSISSEIHFSSNHSNKMLEKETDYESVCWSTRKKGSI